MKTKTSKTTPDPSIKDRYFLLPYTKIIKSSTGNSLKLADDQAYIADIELSEERYRFNATGNPFSAINIFITCIEKGYYPPIEVLTFLSTNFNECINNNKPIDATMGLTKSAKQKYEISKRNIHIVLEIDTLRHYFKLDTSDAINAVARRYEDMEIKLKYTTIYDIYFRDGKKEHDHSLQFLHEDISWLDEMPEEYRNEWKSDYLDRYPRDIKEFIHNMDR